MACNKNGECLIQCGHKLHNGYCPSKCCTPVECRNFSHCRKHLPKWVSTCNNGMCVDCSARMGYHTYKDGECCVCLEKSMILLKCNHTICNDCLFATEECPKECPKECPLYHKNNLNRTTK
jgi:hypothetical protein